MTLGEGLQREPSFANAYFSVLVFIFDLESSLSTSLLCGFEFFALLKEGLMKFDNKKPLTKATLECIAGEERSSYDQFHFSGLSSLQQICSLYQMQ